MERQGYERNRGVDVDVEVVARRRRIEADVGHQPVLAVALAVECDAEAAADDAVSPVAADDPAGGERLAVRSARTLDGQLDLLVVLAQVGHLDATLDGDALPVEMPVEDPLGHVLAEVEHERVRRVEAVEADAHRLPLLGVEREPVEAMADREELLDQPELAKDLECSGMDSVARDSVGGSLRRSNTFTLTPRRASSIASITPVGPAPTTATDSGPS